MMCISINSCRHFIPVLIIVWLAGCKSSSDEVKYSPDPRGYEWKLVSFTNEEKNYHQYHIAWVNAVFKTQDDSVFYDSEHDMRDRLFITIDTNTSHLLRHLVSRCDEGDSVSARFPLAQFFTQQFNKKPPLFCNGDSHVQVDLKVKQIIPPEKFKLVINKIQNDELQEIEDHLGGAQNFENARDPSGFYWINKPVETHSDSIKPGEQISISYSGAFLNGRVMDAASDFRFIYGTPDQVIKGLNIVIGRMKKGQNSKIILPSHLAFGEGGSSNGSIPPYTPMLYTISINETTK